MRFAKLALVFLLSSISRIVAPPTGLDICHETSMLMPSDGAAGDGYGAAVHVSTTALAVGAPWTNKTAGAVYLYMPGAAPGTWQFMQKLAEPDAKLFGHQIAISGHTLIVGAPSDYQAYYAPGRAYIYSPDEFGQYVQREVLFSTEQAVPYFAICVAIEGTTAVVGDLAAAAVFIYTSYHEDWVNGTSHYQKVSVNDTTSGFGVSAAISGSHLLLGAPWKDNYAGAIYHYMLDQGEWGQVSKFVPADSNQGDNFGYDIDLKWPLAVVGAPSKSVDKGSTYILSGDALGIFSETGAVVSPNNFSGFGISVAFIDDSLLAVGALHGRGSIDVFQIDGSYVETFEPHVPVPLGALSSSVGASSMAVVSGTPAVGYGGSVDYNNSVNGDGIGAAYYYQLPCTQTTPTTAPTKPPTKVPAMPPTKAPTRLPTKAPTRPPTKLPTKSPTKPPTKHPTRALTKSPTKVPTKRPTKAPTKRPTKAPTKSPTKTPTKRPTRAPTKSPTKVPTKPCKGNGLGSAQSPNRCV